MTIVVIFWCGKTAASNIDPDTIGLRYAWGENTGWISFACENDDLQTL